MDIMNALIFKGILEGTDIYRDGQTEIHFTLADPRISDVDVGPNTSAFVDWDLPVLSGLEVCRRLRSNSSTSRVWITLAAKEFNVESRRRAAQVGANECVSGPVTRDLIIESIKSRLNRSLPVPSGDLRYGDLMVDHAARLVFWKDKHVALMPSQLRLLCFMMDNPGQVFTRIQITEAIGDGDAHLDERTVDVWIGRLRRALGSIGAKGVLRTVRSRGYFLDVPKSQSKTIKC